MSVDALTGAAATRAGAVPSRAASWATVTGVADLTSTPLAPRSTRQVSQIPAGARRWSRPGSGGSATSCGQTMPRLGQPGRRAARRPTRWCARRRATCRRPSAATCGCPGTAPTAGRSTGGKTSLMVLCDQLDLLGLEDGRRVRRGVPAADADALVAHGRFLAEKFGRGSTGGVARASGDAVTRPAAPRTLDRALGGAGRDGRRCRRGTARCRGRRDRRGCQQPDLARRARELASSRPARTAAAFSAAAAPRPGLAQRADPDPGRQLVAAGSAQAEPYARRAGRGGGQRLHPGRAVAARSRTRPCWPRPSCGPSGRGRPAAGGPGRRPCSGR